MKNTTYSEVYAMMEAKEADARNQAAEYAEGEEYGESQWQDGRAAGIREAMALLRMLDPERR